MSADGRLANVRPIQPIRVLLASRDRRYLRVTAFLLEQNGFHVRRTSKVDPSLLALLDRHELHVVLLDATASLADAARTATAAAALYDRVRLVLATEGGAEQPKGLTAIDKWAPIETVAAELREAFMNLPRARQAAQSG